MRRYIHWILRHRLAVIVLILAVSAVLLPQAARLRVVIDPSTMLPSTHPYVVATNKIADLFGSQYTVMIGVTPKTGDVFQANVLNKVRRITAALMKTSGVIHGNVTSLAASKVKNITGRHDELQVKPLMADGPQTEAQMAALRRALRDNPIYSNLIVSADMRTAAVIADVRAGRRGFHGVVNRIEAIATQEQDASVKIRVAGLPVYLSEVEIYSNRARYLLPLTIVIIGLLHLEAFRTIQGLLLPLLTAVLATGWDMGIMGIAGIPVDVVTVTTPVVVLAVAAGHAVQMLKRYYEEYGHIRRRSGVSPVKANRVAIVHALVRVGPVMLAAGATAALGFFSLIVFSIPTVRTFGVVTGAGILSALILEMTLIPAVRSLLRPPRDEQLLRRRQGARRWDYVTQAIARSVTGPYRLRVYTTVLVLLVLSAAGATRVVADNSLKSYFAQNFSFERADRFLNHALGGTDTLALLVKGARAGVIKDPGVLRAIDSTQRFLEKQPFVGKTLSIADIIKRLNKAMHNDNPKYFRIPKRRDLIAQYLLLYSMSGDLSDFNSYVDDGYRYANVTALLKNDNSAYLNKLVGRINRFTSAHFDKNVQVEIGGSAAENAALNDVMVRNKLLSVAIIAVVVFSISAVMFRSLTAGVLVVIPLLVTVVVNLGIMGWSGIPLNIPTSLSFAIVIGVGADYAIYLIYRIREQIDKGDAEMAAIRESLETAGKACLYVASAIASGYSVLLFSYGFYVHIWMGILMVSAMAVSALSALTLIPALILSVRPNFIFRHKPAPVVVSRIAATLLIAALGLFALPRPVYAGGSSAHAIMERNFVVSRVEDSVSTATMILIDKSGDKRIRKVESITKLERNGVNNMRMTRFLWPPDVMGTATLLIERSKRDDDMWVYLPALAKVRRLVASNKRDSFMGTDFSYGDVIGYRVRNWRHRMLRVDVERGHPCYVIESLPRMASVESSSGYSKSVSWIRKDNDVTAKEEFWDQSGEPLKTLTFGDVRLVDTLHHKWQPMRLQAVNLQTGHKTIIQITDFKANQGLEDYKFSPRYLEHGP
ncbi:MAG: outer membrane lipoprotein-sorting protein [Acidiferrobacterales bacterium]